MLPNNPDAITDEEMDAILDETGELAAQLDEDFMNDADSEILSDGTEQVANIAAAKTYRLDFDTGEIIGKIEEMTAMRQYIIKALFTARNAHEIYSDEYASEIEEILWEDESTEYTAVELERVIREAIENDDRMIEVENVEITFERDEIRAIIDCNTIYGQLTEEVQLNGGI